jgi:hypothetical protein
MFLPLVFATATLYSGLRITEAPYSSMRDVRGTSKWTIPRNRTIKTKINRAFKKKKLFLKRLY